MFVVSSEDMKQIDKRAIEKYKIPGIILMENAAFAVLEEIEKLKPRNVTIVCGIGNNGGDGFALARLLLNKNYEVDVFCFPDKTKVKGDAKVNLDILINMGLEIKSDLEKLREKVKSSDLVVDAVLGTGISGEVRDDIKKVIDVINDANKILSVDIPSGISSDDGKCLGKCVFADITVTFECLKFGHILGEGREASGKVLVKKIGIPKECIKEQNIKTLTNDDGYPMYLIKRRRIDTNKGNYGKVFIIGGNYKMSGAVILALKSALRSGAGLVYGVFPRSIMDRVGALVPEAVYIPCDEKNGYIFIDEANLNIILDKADAIAFGVGLGNYDELFVTLKEILKRYDKNLVIDADGINILSKDVSILKNSKANVLLTPHPAEMARLTGLCVEFINKNRVEVAKKFAKEYRCIVLLKGASTVVTDGENVYINTTGNPGMATAGSGDVLTGLIVSLLGQGYNLFDSAVLGAYIHGLAGDKAYETYGYGLVAHDILNNFGFFIR